jgi:hypothetical protein
MPTFQSYQNGVVLDELVGPNPVGLEVGRICGVSPTLM